MCPGIERIPGLLRWDCQRLWAYRVDSWLSSTTVLALFVEHPFVDGLGVGLRVRICTTATARFTCTQLRGVPASDAVCHAVINAHGTVADAGALRPQLRR